MLRLIAFLICVLPVWMPQHAQASHYLGGELTYRALGNNLYSITAVLYADCIAGQPAAIDQDIPVYISIYTGDGNTLVQTVDLAATGISMLPQPPAVGCTQIPGPLCVRYTQASAVVNLPPSITGYILVNARCCLPGSVVNVARASEHGVGMRAVIPPSFISGNSSPFFRTLPPQLLCQGQPFSLDLGATDADGDTLRYSLVLPRGGGSLAAPKPNPVPVSFVGLPLANGATPTAPFGPGSPVTIDPTSGRLTGTAYAQGQFLVNVRAEEYRNGSGRGGVERTYVVQVAPCPKSTGAGIVRDEAAVAAGAASISIVRCGGQRSVSFQNSSTGAQRYFWDFGDGSTAADTSSETSPAYTYPAAGTYNLSLIAYGANCNDTLRTAVVLSDDTAPPVFIVAEVERPCAGAAVSFRNSVTDPHLPALSFMWQFEESAANAMPAQAYGTPVFYNTSLPGILRVRHTIRSAGGCLATAVREYEVRGGEVQVSADTVAPKNATLFIEARGGTSYQWTAIEPAQLLSATPPTSARQQVNTSRADTGLRFVCLSTGTNGCRDADTVVITVSEKGYVFVPTAFSPNGDGRNDVLRPRLSGAALAEFVVYNRWGREVFRSTDARNGWDGTMRGVPQPNSTYVWLVRARPGDGPNNAMVTESGDVMLVR